MDGPLPDRLSIYHQQLAVDIAEVVEQEGCDVVVFAGDTLDVPMNQPVVLTSLYRLRDTITKSGVPILCCHGQHDIATKIIDGYLEYQTVLPVYQNGLFHYYHDKVVYFEPGKVPMIIESRKDIPKGGKGVTFYFYGWDNDPCEDLSKADVFVGHHFVNTATDAGGYMFYKGYDPKILSKTYKFSIIGDIHNAQHFEKNVLIPGVPIQNKFSDNATCGVWVIDTETWTDKFIEFNSKTYPKYYLVKEETDIPATHPVNHHYRLASRVHAEGASKVIASDIDKIDLWQIIEDTIDRIEKKEVTKDKRACIKEAARVLFDAQQTKSFKSKTLPVVEPKRIVIKDFVSIKRAEFAFPEGLTLISGDIGSGKSSLLEAVPYAFYGDFYKMGTVEDVRPTTYKGDTEVKLDFTVNGTWYRIIRGIGSLKLFVNVTQDSEGAQIPGASMRDTQEKINRILQMSYSEYCSMVFFSQGVHSFFKHVSKDDQMSLMNLFLGSTSERILDLSSDVKALKKKYHDEAIKLQGAIDNAKEIIERHKVQLQTELVKQDSLEQRQMNSLASRGYTNVSPEVVSLMVAGSTDEAINLNFGVDIQSVRDRREVLRDTREKIRSSYYTAERSYEKDQTALEDLKKEVARLEKSITTYKSGICPTCNRPLPVDKDSLKEQAKELKRKKLEIDSLEKSLANGRHVEIESLKTQFSVVDKKTSDHDRIIEEAKKFGACAVQPYDGSLEIDRLQKTIADQTKNMADNVSLLSGKQDQEFYYTILDSHVFSDKGVRARCLDSVGEMMSSYINRLFTSIGVDCRVIIKTVSEFKNKQPKAGFSVEARFNGVRTSYHMASGGQRMLIDLASISAIYNLLSDTYKLDHGIMGMLVLDEFVNYLDEENVEAVSDLLDSFNTRSLFLVSHDTKMKQLVCTQTVRVQRKDGISHYSM
jgi:DNA repair exonuclease SbcCD nuclease subunit